MWPKNELLKGRIHSEAPALCHLWPAVCQTSFIFQIPLDEADGEGIVAYFFGE